MKNRTTPKIGERERGKRATPAINWLLDLLNLDFQSTDQEEKDRLSRILRTSSPPPEIAAVRSVRNMLIPLIDPLIVTDADAVIRQRILFLERLIQISKAQLQPPETETGMSKDEIENEIEGFNRHIRRLKRMSQRRRRADLDSDREKALRELASTLNVWADSGKVKPQWQAEEVKGNGDIEPDQGRYWIGKKQFIVRPWRQTEHDITNTAFLYVARCLETSQLSRVRHCLGCGKYFFARDFRQKFHSSECQDRYDKKAAGKRMAARRKQHARQLRGYAMAVLGNLSLGNRAAILRVKEILEESSDAIDEMLTEMAKGARKEAVWSRASAKRRGLFRKLQSAGFA